MPAGTDDNSGPDEAPPCPDVLSVSSKLPGAEGGREKNPEWNEFTRNWLVSSSAIKYSGDSRKKLETVMENTGFYIIVYLSFAADML